MNDLLPHETLIHGRWNIHGNQVSASESCLRIEWLLKHKLRKIALSIDGWEALYEDPNDSRKWILYYPEGELHNGGPPSIRLATHKEIQSNFRRSK